MHGRPETPRGRCSAAQRPVLVAPLPARLRRLLFQRPLFSTSEPASQPRRLSLCLCPPLRASLPGCARRLPAPPPPQDARGARPGAAQAAGRAGGRAGGGRGQQPEAGTGGGRRAPGPWNQPVQRGGRRRRRGRQAGTGLGRAGACVCVGRGGGGDWPAWAPRWRAETGMEVTEAWARSLRAAHAGCTQLGSPPLPLRAEPHSLEMWVPGGKGGKGTGAQRLSAHAPGPGAGQSWQPLACVS